MDPVDQSIHDYTTKIHKQAILLEISIDNSIVFVKYVRGLHKSIRKESKLFKVKDINEANVKAIGINNKNRTTKGKATSFKKAAEN